MEDEGNLSLVSYEDTDTENEKYYNEEELTNNMGLAEIEAKARLAKKDKDDKNNNSRCFI